MDTDPNTPPTVAPKKPPKRTTLILLLLILLLPALVWGANQASRLFSKAASPAIASVRIDPGMIIADNKPGNVFLSTLAYDTAGNPIWSGIRYQWGISTTNSIGTLWPNTDEKLASFEPSMKNRGTGDIWVKAFATNGQMVIGSIPVYVGVTPPPSPTGTPTTTELIQETDPRITYTGQWTNFSDPQASGGSLKYTNQQPSSVSLTFVGNGVSYVRLKHPNRGIVKVEIDGQTVATLDNYASSYLWQQETSYPNLAQGQHTITISNTGTKNPAATNTFWDLDAFKVTSKAPSPTTSPQPSTTPVPSTQLIQETDPRITYIGSFTNFTDPQASGGSLKYSDQKDASVSLAFTGTSITYYRIKHPNRGMVDVYIDNNKVDTLDNYSPTFLWQQQKTYNVTAGSHTIKIINTATKNPAATGTFFDLDAFGVSTIPAPTPAPPTVQSISLTNACLLANNDLGFTNATITCSNGQVTPFSSTCQPFDYWKTKAQDNCAQ